MNRLKKIVAIAAATMLLCGFICQAAEGDDEPEKPIPPHKHSYSRISSTCTGTTVESQHPYLDNQSGKYANCDVILFFYHDVYKCIKCGDQIENFYNVRRHMKCGQ